MPTTMQMLPTSISALRRFYTAPHVGYIMDSIIEGNTIADGFADQPDDISAGLVWDRQHCIYLADGEGRPDRSSVAEYLCTRILTEDARKRLHAVKIHYQNDEWEAFMQSAFRFCKYRVLKRRLYLHGLESLPDARAQDPGIQIQPITDSMLRDSRVGNIQGLICEIRQMWGDIESFLKSGYGYCATDGKVLASWCTAEYLSSRYCGIGVETIESYRKKGLSTACTAAFLQRCAAQGILAYWDCWRDNVPSVKVAEKLGFEMIEEYNCALLTFE